MLTNDALHLGDSPSVIIEQLQKDLSIAIAKAYRISPTTKFNELLKEMNEIFVKLNMAKLMQDRRVVSITGLQGVGKTRLIRDLYGLDDSLLPSTPGVGEIIPVLFTEKKGITQPSYYVRKAVRNDVTGIFDLVDQEITLEEINAKSRDYEADELWLEVIVPQRYFHTEISLALLPGFERNKREVSQKYLELFMKLSTSAVLIVNHKKLAQKPQQLLLDKVSRTYKENAPVFVVSFAEELNENERETIRESISTKFDVSTEEQNRIVFSGISEEFQDSSEKVVNAIKTYNLTNMDGYQKQLDMLTDLSSGLNDLLTELVEELKRMATSEQENSQGGQNTIQEITEAFKKYRKDVLTKAESEIGKALNLHAMNCSEQIEQQIKDEQSKGWEKFKAYFVKDMTFEQRVQLKEDLREIWHGETSYEAEKKVIYSLENYVKNASDKLEYSNQTLLQGSSNELMVTNNLISTSLANIEDYIDYTKKDIQIKPEDLKVLPIVAVGIAQEMLVASLVLENESYQTTNGQLNERLLQDIAIEAGKITKDIENLTLSTSNVIKGAAVFFGIDALDGTLNTFGALTGLLTSVGVSSAAATPLGLAIVGAIGTGLAVSQGAQRIEKYKFQRNTLAKETFHTVASIQKESTVALIGNILDEMEQKLMDAYHLRRGTNERFGLYEELENRVHRLQLTCGKLQELAFRNASYIH